MMEHPPICPEALLDLIQAAGAHTSEIEGQGKFGQALLRFYFKELPKQFEGDERAHAYLTEVLACAGSAIRGFSVERTAFKASRAREEKIEELRQKLLGRPMIYSPLEKSMAGTAYGLMAKALGLSLGVIPQFFIPSGAPSWLVFAIRMAFLWLPLALLLPVQGVYLLL